MTRLPIRVRLTAAFAVATLFFLAAAALFVGIRLRDDLDDRVAANLRARAAAAVDAQRHGTPIADVALDDREESFVQVVSATGRPLETDGRLRGPALTQADVARASTRDLTIERRLPGIDGAARFVTRALGSGPDRVVIVVGESLADRNDALSSVVRSFVIGGIAVVVLASGVGYFLARAGLAPVEAMRRRAREVSFGGGTTALPLPHARDEIRRLGETLNEMLDRLRGSYAREQRFVADASHELRTPVAVIRTELEGALATGDYGPEVRDALVASVDECTRLARLAEDLLVLARAGDGGLPLRREIVAIPPIAAAIVEQYCAPAARDHRTIGVEMDPHLTADLDPARGRQILTNLVDNAVRHGSGRITVRAHDRDGDLVLEVQDEGDGFAPEFTSRAFERFARGDARDTDGAGLGLALVDEIARAHGGAATIDATQRSTVRVVIPRTAAPS